MPVARQRIEDLSGRTADLIGTDGTSLVVTLGPIEDRDGAVQLHFQVLAVERRGSRWRFEPGAPGIVPLAEVEDARPVVFLSGSGM